MTPTQRVAPGLTPDFTNIEATRSYIESVVASIVGQGLLQAAERLQLVRGGVTTTTPTVDFGAGFTITKTGVGDVTISFSTAFSGVPAVVCTAQYVAATNVTCTLHVTQPANRGGGFRVIRYNTNTGALEDGPLVFIAMGAPAN